jgi:hypothetical protein
VGLCQFERALPHPTTLVSGLCWARPCGRRVDWLRASVSPGDLAEISRVATINFFERAGFRENAVAALPLTRSVAAVAWA